MLLVAFGASIAVRAQEETAPPAWEFSGLPGGAFDLFTPISGAFFANAPDGLFRSDDAGATWRPVALPFAVDPRSGLQVAITPTDHTVLYAAGPSGVYRTRDDARTWTLVYPTPDYRVLSISVSPADPNVVYLALTGLATPSSKWRFLRSRDAGTTFESIEEGFFGTCGMTVNILLPDRLDRSTLYRAAPCVAGRTTSVGLVVSHDQGHTLMVSFNESLEYAQALVGGYGVDRTRFYLASVRDRRAGGSTLFRSDDAAQSWTSVLEYRPETDGGNVWLADVAYDPTAPDHVWIALGAGADGVQSSVDGGVTWQDAGGHGLGRPQRLVLGIDSRNLYLATDQGVWRQRLNDASS